MSFQPSQELMTGERKGGGSARMNLHTVYCISWCADVLIQWHVRGWAAVCNGARRAVSPFTCLQLLENFTKFWIPAFPKFIAALPYKCIMPIGRVTSFDCDHHLCVFVFYSTGAAEASAYSNIASTIGSLLGELLFLALQSPDFCNRWLRKIPSHTGLVSVSGRVF